METDSLTYSLIELHKKICDSEIKSFLQTEFSSDKKIVETLERLMKDLRHHIYKEEKILFPYLINLSRTQRREIPYEKPFFETVENPVQILKSEHELIAESLNEIKKQIENLDQSSGSKNSVMKKLNKFLELVESVLYLENQILFPLAIETERSIRKLN
jgi:regulator of cell morphogenesis and NO signaling